MALLLAVLTFSVMQLFKADLAAGRFQTILGGFVGSWFFIFLLTVRREVESPPVLRREDYPQLSLDYVECVCQVLTPIP